MSKQIFSLILIILLGTNLVTAQDKLLSGRKLVKEPTFTTIDDAMATPDKVYKLDLSQQKPVLKKIPKEVFEFKNLQELNISGNRIDELPDELFKLTNLQKLNFSSNYIKEIPNEIKQLSNLEILDAKGCQLKVIPTELSELSNLEELYLFANFIEVFPSELSILNLKKINILKNKMPAKEIEKVMKMFPKAKFDAF